ncbi:MAG: fibronectin type III domain-containing protein, partial [Candidatus Eisenbacteria bacterium]|nr:fibronectin type III domain-containing protein [Candidatus Eisenbacteria bacterium]
SPDEASAVTLYEIQRSTSPEGPFETVGQIPAGTTSYTDNSVKDETGYYYRIVSVGSGSGPWETTPAVGPATSHGQWFDARKLPTLLLTFAFCVAVVFLIGQARRGRPFYIRPIPGLAAVDEAIGRATEMGKPILFVSGLGTAGDVATLAAFTLLGRVARRTAEYQTQVIVPCYDPIVMTISQEIVKSSYLDAGRPELYRQDDIFFVTQDQFPFTAAVNGIMLRDRPATNFYIGKFYAESLVLAETGNIAGSIQIAGTDEMTQIPFFVAACDYTLIGEELYASSAYLSQEPPLLGTLKAQDWGKALAAFLIVAGAILAAFGQSWFVRFFQVQ